MAVLINGNGNEAIYAQQDADWYAALMGGVTMITAVGQQFAYELLDANTIGVKDGVIITKEGRRIQVDTNVIDTFDIPTGAQGTTNYYIIGYHLVTDEESVQSAETFVQLMDNGTDTIPEGSFKEGDDDVYVSLYRVEQDDLTIGTITLLLPTVSESMQQQISQINADLSANYYDKATIDAYFLKKTQIIYRDVWSDYISCNKGVGNFKYAEAAIPLIDGYSPILVVPMGFENHLIEYTVNLMGFNTTTITFYLIGINNVSAELTNTKVGFRVLYKAN